MEIQKIKVTDWDLADLINAVKDLYPINCATCN